MIILIDVVFSYNLSLYDFEPSVKFFSSTFPAFVCPKIITWFLIYGFFKHSKEAPCYFVFRK